MIKTARIFTIICIFLAIVHLWFDNWNVATYVFLVGVFTSNSADFAELKEEINKLKNERTED